MKIRITTLIFVCTLVGCGGGGGGSPAADPAPSSSSDVTTTESGSDDETIQPAMEESDEDNNGSDSEDLSVLVDSDNAEIDDDTTDIDGISASETDSENVVDEAAQNSDNGASTIDSVLPSSLRFGMIAYDLSEFGGSGFPQSFQVDQYGNIAFHDEILGQLPLLMAGTLNGITSTQSVSSRALGIEPATQISQISDLSMAIDRTVAFQIRLAGSRPGYALVSWDTDDLSMFVRTGEQITPVNGPGGKVRNVGTPSRVVGGAFFTVTYDDSSGALLFHDGESFTVVAGTRKNETFASLGEPDCNVFLGPRSLIFNDADPVRIGTDLNSVIFPASFDSSCPYSSAIVQYTDGAYSVVLANGQSVPSVDSSMFGYQNLADVAADGSIAVISTVGRDSRVEQPGVDRGFSVSAWHIPFSQEPVLLAIQGESVETDESQYFLDRNFLFSPAVQFRHAPGGRYAVRAEFDSETAIFVGSVRDPMPYSSFDTVGASSLEFRVSTLSTVPLPYDEKAFFRDVNMIDVLENGWLLFDSSISTAALNGRIVSERWMSDSDGNISLIASPNDEIPLTTGGSVAFRRLSLEDPIPMTDGSVLFQSGGYLLRMYPDRE